MAEYIEREKVIESIKKSVYELVCYAKADAISRIQAESAEDVAPVRHGKWISLTKCSNEGVYCSVCNKKVYKTDYAWSNKRIKTRSNYCPNCGAKMDLEK